MTHNRTTITTSTVVSVGPSAAFETLVDELSLACNRSRLTFDPGPRGQIRDDASVIGRVTTWNPAERIEFEWETAAWTSSEPTEIELRFESIDDGTRITMEHRGFDRLFDSDTALVGWAVTEVLIPYFEATTPTVFGDWLTDRRGRRPAGSEAREEYGDPLYHYPNFRVILDELALNGDDHLLEIGCGGGVLLNTALESGCRATAVDHSSEMVRLTTRTNHRAVTEGRLLVLEADGAVLPFPDRTFTCATMTGVLGHLPDPETVFTELHRVLDTDGRMVVLGSDPELRDTPAAPEPMSSRMQFYESQDLESMARTAGFDDVQVVRQTLEPYAREVGVPDEQLSLFEYPSRFLRARKSPI